MVEHNLLLVEQNSVAKVLILAEFTALGGIWQNYHEKWQIAEFSARSGGFKEFN